ncbi:hypothetical protein [Roseovarius sp. SYSU LYC5161]|uniref:hypothetical protein n=1 Tax=Roseovarius halophilus (ex Wu et al. 2025) TaxID=3376060 RepID=UPI00399C04C1
MVLFPLAGCSGAGFGEAPRQVPLFGGEVMVAGPPGYCVDQGSLRRGPGGSFVLLTGCDRVSGRPERGVQPAVMTVSVMPRPDAPLGSLSEELASSVAPAKILERYEADEVSLVQLGEGGDQLLPEGDPRYWRAVVEVKGHLTGLAVYGPRGSAVSGPEGRRLVLALAGSILDASTSDGVDRASTGEPETGSTGLAGFLGGLFPNDE